MYYPQNDTETWYRDTYVLWSYVYCFDWEFIGGCERDEFNRKDMRRMLENDWFINSLKELNDVIALLKKDGVDNKDGWDLCRAMQLLACAYLANYFEREELNSRSKEIALIIQTTFSSWEELIESYLSGLEKWGLNDIDEPIAYLAIRERRNAYNLLRVTPKAPFRMNWYLEFE